MARLTPEKHKLRLLELKAEILAEGDDEIDPVVDDAVGITKPDQDAQPLAEMNQVIASSRNRNRTEILARIVAALGRLEREPEACGLCSECGEDILPRRLELMPYVELCVECQGSRDLPRHPTGRRHLRDFE
jgi:DnaK suppressor protein